MIPKRIISIVLIATVFVGIFACSGKEKTIKEKPNQPQMMAGNDANQSHMKVKLPTVQCGMCENTIEGGLAKLDGILSVDVDIDKKVGHIDYDPAKTDAAEIEQAIASLGYQANETMAKPDAYDKLPNCCKLPQDRM